MQQLLDEIFDQLTLEELKGYLSISLRIILIIFLAMLFYKIVKKLIHKIVVNEKVNPSQAKTVVSILQSAIKYIISFIAIMMILVILNIDITPILTSAGILGFAVGFGSQNLVRDIISGFFIIFEGQIHVGDFVEINGGKIRGTVEDIGLRITKVREWSMKLNYIPNGEIKLVNNLTRGKMRAIIDVTVPYNQEIRYVQNVLEEVCQKIYLEQNDKLLDEPEILGITSIDEKGVTFTVMALTTPDSYWFIGRELRKVILEEFSKSEVIIAYPYRVIKNVK